MPIRQRLSSAYGGPDARLDRVAADLRSAISPTSSARLIDVLATIVAVGRTRPILASPTTLRVRGKSGVGCRQ
jgi:hypothetical protein